MGSSTWGVLVTRPTEVRAPPAFKPIGMANSVILRANQQAPSKPWVATNHHLGCCQLL